MAFGCRAIYLWGEVKKMFLAQIDLDLGHNLLSEWIQFYMVVTDFTVEYVEYTIPS